MLVRPEIYKDRHCVGGTTEAIPAIGVVREIGCSTTGLLRTDTLSFASARNDVKTLIIEIN